MALEPGRSASRPLVGRLAPSPTGVLHLGNARSFLLAWLSIRSRSGRLLLRIEDIDGPRVKPESIAQTIDLLRWLGLDWDGEALIQSTRRDAHASAARRLERAGLAYPCICSRKEIDEAASAPHEATADGPVYPGVCRGRYRDREDARRESGREAALRFRVETGAVPFTDGFRGAEDGRIEGDFVIAKRDGAAAYQLAVVVDDAAAGVTEVLRGDDLVPSTPRQLLLHRALDLDPPDYVHLPLVVGSDGLRLAKRHGDTSLEAYRRRGRRAEEIVGWLAWISGQQADPSPCLPRDLLAGFRLDRVPRGPVVVAPDAVF